MDARVNRVAVVAAACRVDRKKLVDVHAILQIPKNQHTSGFAHLPGSIFARTDKDQTALEDHRAVRIAADDLYHAAAHAAGADSHTAGRDHNAYTDPSFSKDIKVTRNPHPYSHWNRWHHEKSHVNAKMSILKKIAGAGRSRPLTTLLQTNPKSGISESKPKSEEYKKTQIGKNQITQIRRKLFWVCLF